jgi:hypothetical protein
MNFLDRLSEQIKVSDLMQILPAAAKLFHAGGRTDGLTEMAKLLIAIRISSKASRNYIGVKYQAGELY